MSISPVSGQIPTSNVQARASAPSPTIGTSSLKVSRGPDQTLSQPTSEADRPDETGQRKGRAHGVIRNLAEGHFKGRAFEVLRRNFADELAARGISLDDPSDDAGAEEPKPTEDLGATEPAGDQFNLHGGLDVLA